MANHLLFFYNQLLPAIRVMRRHYTRLYIIVFISFNTGITTFKKLNRAKKQRIVQDLSKDQTYRQQCMSPWAYKCTHFFISNKWARNAPFCSRSPYVTLAVTGRELLPLQLLSKHGSLVLTIRTELLPYQITQIQ